MKGQISSDSGTFSLHCMHGCWAYTARAMASASAAYAQELCDPNSCVHCRLIIYPLLDEGRDQTFCHCAGFKKVVILRHLQPVAAVESCFVTQQPVRGSLYNRASISRPGLLLACWDLVVGGFRLECAPG